MEWHTLKEHTVEKHAQCVGNSEGANSGLKLVLVAGGASDMPAHCSCCKLRTNATLTTAAAAADGDTAANVTPPLAFLSKNDADAANPETSSGLVDASASKVTLPLAF